MKEIKAFMHRNRIADVVHALVSANFNKGSYKAMSRAALTHWMAKKKIILLNLEKA